jgi:beta-lactamase superfamily II metal-dependent hydrolase
MGLPELYIVDVGHGNSAVLRDSEGTVIIDCAPGATLKELLEQLGIFQVSRILISHADEDHIGGIMTLLTDSRFQVSEIYLNSDALRRTEVWQDFRITVAEAHKRGGPHMHVELTTVLTGSLNVGEVNIEVLAPSPELAVAGAGGNDLKGRTLSAHSTSAVLGLSHGGHRVALFAGDIDRVGLDNLFDEADDLAAEILVFPHHGGNPGGGNLQEFAQVLSEKVQPKAVVFSNHHTKHRNPREDIVSGILQSVPTAHIMCTELAKRCSEHIAESSGYTLSLPARGITDRRCCAGTISVQMAGTESSYLPDHDHRQFVETIPEALCRRLRPT